MKIVDGNSGGFPKLIPVPILCFPSSSRDLLLSILETSFLLPLNRVVPYPLLVGIPSFHGVASLPERSQQMYVFLEFSRLLLLLAINTSPGNIFKGG